MTSNDSFLDQYRDLVERVSILERYTGGGGALINIDGGEPATLYGDIQSIDAGEI